MSVSQSIWVLGATGRIGRVVASRLLSAGVEVVLTGRDEERLLALRRELPGDAQVRAGSLEVLLQGIATEAPRVVVNTVGPFSTTAPRVLEALGDGVHYVDVSNDAATLGVVSNADQRARQRGATYVAASGFGVLAAESAALEAMSRAARAGVAPVSVRVDAMASVANEGGRIGEALGHTIVEGFAASGAEVRGERVVRAGLGGRRAVVMTPDGDRVVTGSMPNGDLEAVWRATGATEVVIGNALAPSRPAIRALLVVLRAISRIPGASGFLARQIGSRSAPASSQPREHSWARAQLTWADGTSQTTWFRAGEGMAFTAAAATETAVRLVKGEGTPGAWTPGALFGSDLAVAAGAEFLEG